jgi:hypothetical protein
MNAPDRCVLFISCAIFRYPTRDVFRHDVFRHNGGEVNSQGDGEYRVPRAFFTQTGEHPKSASSH